MGKNSQVGTATRSLSRFSRINDKEVCKAKTLHRRHFLGLSTAGGCTGGGTISDPNGVTEIAACGAHLVVFTTGRGTVTGSGVVPVLKVCGNLETCARMRDNMDIDAGAIITGDKSIAQVGEAIVAAIVATAQGELTRAEDLGHFEFHI